MLFFFRYVFSSEPQHIGQRDERARYGVPNDKECLLLFVDTLVLNSPVVSRESTLLSVSVLYDELDGHEPSLAPLPTWPFFFHVFPHVQCVLWYIGVSGDSNRRVAALVELTEYGILARLSWLSDIGYLRVSR